MQPVGSPGFKQNLVRASLEYSANVCLERGENLREQARILVVEQDETLRSSLIVALEGAGFEVTSASDGFEGLNSYYESYPDLVIMGNELPEVNGAAPASKVRQASYLPIITLGNDPQAVDDVLNQGADDYMAAPISHPELVARVRSLLRRRWGQSRTGINSSPNKAPVLG